MTQNDTRVDDMEADLRRLADQWMAEAETYIESDVDSEQSMAAQQYQDAEKLRQVLDHYTGADTDHDSD